MNANVHHRSAGLRLSLVLERVASILALLPLLLICINLIFQYAYMPMDPTEVMEYHSNSGGLYIGLALGCVLLWLFSCTACAGKTVRAENGRSPVC